MYYIRKLSNNPNLIKIKNSQNVNDLEADILRQEVGTTKNTLSFWKCDNLQNLQTTITAILLSTTAIKKYQFYIIDDKILDKYKLQMDDSELGQTAYLGYENLHSNMINLNYGKIGNVLWMLHEVFQNDNLIVQVNKQTAKQYIEEASNKGLLNKDNLDEHLKNDIDKYILKVN